MRSAHYTQNALAVRYNNLLFIINFIKKKSEESVVRARGLHKGKQKANSKLNGHIWTKMMVSTFLSFEFILFYFLSNQSHLVVNEHGAACAHKQ